MSEYTDLTGWRAAAAGTRFRTTAPMRWEIGAVGSGAWVEVPAGFVFDVSVPRPARWLFDPLDERFLKAACLHDFVLSRGWSRTSAAGPFADALAAEGVPSLARFVMVAAVIIWKWK